MEYRAVLLYVSKIFLLSAAELVLERSPACPGDSAVYRCTVSGMEEVSWTWTTLSSSTTRYSVIPGFSMPGIVNQTIDDTLVQFNLTDVGPPFTNIIATVFSPQQLNGSRFTCEGQQLTIQFLNQRNSLPTSLTISPNGSTVHIYPNMGYDVGILYQLSESATPMRLSVPVPLQIPDSITFIQCQINSTFIIDTCIFESHSDDTNFILYSSGIWEISRRCSPPTINVTCSNGNWSEDISCQEIDTTSKQFIIPTTQEVASNNNNIAVSSTMNNHTSMDCPQCYGQVVGSAIGSFILALILGIIIGLLIGMKSKRKRTMQKSAGENLEYPTNRSETLYEDIKLDKVEMSKNVSYEMVKQA